MPAGWNYHSGKAASAFRGNKNAAFPRDSCALGREEKRLWRRREMPRDDWQRAKRKDIGRREAARQDFERSQGRKKRRQKKAKASKAVSSPSGGNETRRPSRSENAQAATMEEGLIRSLAGMHGLSLSVSMLNGPHMKTPHWRFIDQDGNEILHYWPAKGTVWAKGQRKAKVADQHQALLLARWLIDEVDAGEIKELKAAGFIQQAKE